MSRTLLTNGCRLGIAMTIVTLAGGSAAVAQSKPARYEYTSPTEFHQPVSPYPVEMGFSQHHSSTAFEGAQRGRAAVIQAWGHYQLSESQARILRQQARALDRENDLRQTEALHAQQAMWREAHENERKHHEARVAEAKVKLAAKRSTVYLDTYRLPPTVFNRFTGEIRWPIALQDDAYQANRARIEELFRLQLSYGDPQADVSKEIASCCKQLAQLLRREAGSLPRDEYLAGQKFLVGLKLEARSMTDAA